MVFHMRWISQVLSSEIRRFVVQKSISHEKIYNNAYFVWRIFNKYLHMLLLQYLKAGYGLENALMKYIPEHLNASDGLS